MKQSKITAETTNSFSLENICRSDNMMKNLLDIIESHPSETAVNFGRSIIYFIEDDFEKTTRYLEFLIQAFPNTLLLHRRIAQVFIRENKYEKAIIHLEKVLELNEEDLTAKIWLNLSYFKVGNTEKANSSLQDLNKFVFILKVTESKYLGLDS